MNNQIFTSDQTKQPSWTVIPIESRFSLEGISTSSANKNFCTRFKETKASASELIVYEYAREGKTVEVKESKKELSDVRQKLELTFKKIFEDVKYSTEESQEKRAVFGIQLLILSLLVLSLYLLC